MEAIDREFDRANAEVSRELRRLCRTEAFRKKYSFLADVVAIEFDGDHALVSTSDGETHYVESADLPVPDECFRATGERRND